MYNSEEKYIFDDFKSFLEEAEQPVSKEDMSTYENIFDASANFQYPVSNVTQNWSTLKASLNSNVLVVEQNKTKQVFMFKWLAAAIVLLVLSFSLYQYFAPEKDYNAVFATLDKPNSFLLPDGSIIKLNKNTRVNVLKLNKNERRLKLEAGEALFEVIHNETPFSVETNQGQINVTGTVFNVKIQGENKTRVSLLGGKINFESKTEIIELIPGQTLDVVNGKIDVVLNNNPIAWQNHQLAFSNEELSTIILKLNEYYNVNFIYPEKLSKEKITITFDNLTAQEAAKLLSETISDEVVLK